VRSGRNQNFYSGEAPNFQIDFDSSRRAEWQKVHLSFRQSSLFKRDKDLRDCTVNIYYWNNTRGNILLDNFNVQVREGKPYVYALMEKI